MSLILDIGATGMLAQQMSVEVISNNIANLTTTAFKRQRVEFQDLLYQTKLQPGSASSDSDTKIPTGIQQGLGVKAGAIYRINAQGSLEMTENPLDLAIVDRGYFQITLPDGETAYTRDGSFQLNENGEMVTSDGYLLEPSIVIPEDAQEIIINNDGEVIVKLPNQINLSTVGQIQTAIFQNEAGLEAIGQNLFLETEASGSVTTGNPNQDGFGRLEQGALENSNVDAVQEITNMIQAQRAYEMNSKVIQTGDEMLGTVSNLG